MENDSPYHDGMRALQDAYDSRRLADRLAQVTLRRRFSDDDRAFIEQSVMFFIATADARGQPDCSYKGGLPGFVRVIDENTLAVPDYDGNGMYRTWGNVQVNPLVGLLFLDFQQTKRLRVNGTANIDTGNALTQTFPGAVFVVRVVATAIFPNCPRYIHKMAVEEHSVYAPRNDYAPPVPAWKTFEAFKDALPRGDPSGQKGSGS